jgi:hypothetical protein
MPTRKDDSMKKFEKIRDFLDRGGRGTANDLARIAGCDPSHAKRVADWEVLHGRASVNGNIYSK